MTCKWWVNAYNSAKIYSNRMKCLAINHPVYQDTNNRTRADCIPCISLNTTTMIRRSKRNVFVLFRWCLSVPCDIARSCLLANGNCHHTQLKWQCVRHRIIVYTRSFRGDCSMCARCFISFEYSHLVDMHQLRHRANLTEAMKTTNEWCARMFMCWTFVASKASII